ncbi:MAG: GNAT family N-acetyltransferase [Bacteroidales bacterium]|jgi:putative acetyltransferase|nr:GNAT family N-acetyltransferase [Bacteroidales bacterium]
MKIEKAGPIDYPQIMEVWESSVKATHDFLKPEDFLWYKNVIPTDYLPNLDLYVLRSDSKVLGVMGVSGEDLEMLFISGTSRGKGYGKALLEYAVRELNVKKLDVNEQNAQALGFYEKFGFKIVGRSEKDGMGKDYPILHLSL